MKKTEFIIRAFIIFLIVWTLVWSGVKVWQGYAWDDGYSGFPYKYSHETCKEMECSSEFNLNNLLLDIGILLAASLVITLFSYRVKSSIYWTISAPEPTLRYSRLLLLLKESALPKQAFLQNYIFYRWNSSEEARHGAFLEQIRLLFWILWKILH